MTRQTPSPRQAQWIRRSLYLLPALIFAGTVAFVIRQHTVLDFGLAACIVLGGFVLALCVRKFEKSQTMHLPTKYDYWFTIGFVAIVVIYDIASSLSWQDVLHRTTGLAVKLVLIATLVPFMLFYRSKSTFQELQK